MTGHAIEGEARNGEIGEIVIDGETYSAGIVRRGGAIDVAYLGAPPKSVPCDATLDGESVRVVARSKSLNAAMVSLSVVP